MTIIPQRIQRPPKQLLAAHGMANKAKTLKLTSLEASKLSMTLDKLKAAETIPKTKIAPDIYVSSVHDTNINFAYGIRNDAIVLLDIAREPNEDIRPFILSEAAKKIAVKN